MSRQVLVQVEAEIGFEDATTVMVDGYRAMLDRATEAAVAAAGSHVGSDPALSAFPLGDDVAILPDEPHVSWNAALGTELGFSASDSATLFPSIKGTIEISGMSATHSGVNFVGTYNPRDASGPLADEQVGASIAKVAMEALLASLATQLVAARV